MRSLITSVWQVGLGITSPTRGIMKAHSIFRFVGTLWLQLFVSKSQSPLAAPHRDSNQKNLLNKRRSAPAPQRGTWMSHHQSMAIPATVSCSNTTARQPRSDRFAGYLLRQPIRPTRSAKHANTTLPFDLHGQRNSITAGRIQSGPQPESKQEPE
jgi:hypothetical protein